MRQTSFFPKRAFPCLGLLVPDSALCDLKCRFNTKGRPSGSYVQVWNRQSNLKDEEIIVRQKISDRGVKEHMSSKKSIGYVVRDCWEFSEAFWLRRGFRGG